MTATVPRLGPLAQVGGPRVRLDARPGEVYAYTVRDHVTGLPVPDDYVGQSRNQPRRDLQHRGLAPERDGAVREKPWADRIVSVRIVERGVWTNAELNEREQWWMDTLKPRLNKLGNESNPNRIPIYTQHEQRKARDPNWVIPDWSRPRVSRPVLPRPARSRDVSRPSCARLAVSRLGRWAARTVGPWVGLWLALTIAGLVAGVPDAPAAAAGVTVLGLLAWVGRAKKTSRRRGRRATRRRNR